jgi:hypothetical protein
MFPTNFYGIKMTSIALILKYLWDNKTALLITVFFILCVGFYSYYSYASEKISQYISKNLELNRIIEQKNAIIDSLKKDYESIITSRDELMLLVDKGNKEISSLRDRLFRENRGKKPIGELARNKTVLVEKAVNKATEDVIRCFEKISKNNDEC